MIEKIKKTYNVHKKVLTISLILTLISIFISNIFIQPKVFNVEFMKNNGSHILIEFIFAILIFLTYNFLINFILKLKNKEKFYKTWLINFLIYFGIMIIFLILIWPGHWVWDEFNILAATVNSEINIWQSYLTVIYMTLCLMIIPTAVGIPLIQMIVISLIFSYITSKIYERYNKKLFSIIIYIFMITPAIIINNLYPLRLTMYAYVLLLFISLLIFDKLENKKLTIKKFLIYYLLIPIILLWRSEGILFIIFGPILMFFAYNKNGLSIRKSLMLLILNVFIVFTYNTFMNSLNDNITISKERYGLTIYVNPLSIMIQEDLKGKNIEKDLENINKVFNLEVLRKYPSYIEIPSFWSGELVSEDYMDHLSDFKKSYINIVINNLGSFILARTKTFLATSCLYKDYCGDMDSRLLAYYTKNKYDIDVIENFLEKYPISNPINPSLKTKIENALLGINNKGEYNKIFKLIFWNLIPVTILMIIFGIISLFKNKYLFLSTFIVLLGNVGVIFLTAPANYFMYYFPIYLCGTIVIMIYIYESKSLKNIKIEKQ